MVEKVGGWMGRDGLYLLSACTFGCTFRKKRYLGKGKQDFILSLFIIVGLKSEKVPKAIGLEHCDAKC